MHRKPPHTRTHLPEDCILIGTQARRLYRRRRRLAGVDPLPACHLLRFQRSDYRMPPGIDLPELGRGQSRLAVPQRKADFVLARRAFTKILDPRGSARAQPPAFHARRSLLARAAKVSRQTLKHDIAERLQVVVRHPFRQRQHMRIEHRPAIDTRLHRPDARRIDIAALARAEQHAGPAGLAERQPVAGSGQRLVIVERIFEHAIQRQRDGETGETGLRHSVDSN
jgi:hypothetical protein